MAAAQEDKVEAARVLVRECNCDVNAKSMVRYAIFLLLCQYKWQYDSMNYFCHSFTINYSIIICFIRLVLSSSETWCITLYCAIESEPIAAYICWLLQSQIHQMQVPVYVFRLMEVALAIVLLPLIHTCTWDIFYGLLSLPKGCISSLCYSIPNFSPKQAVFCCCFTPTCLCHQAASTFTRHLLSHAPFWFQTTNKRQTINPLPTVVNRSQQIKQSVYDCCWP